MNKQELLKFHEEVCNKAREVMRKKNADYTGQSDSPFANFERTESMGVCSTEQGFLCRMIDKLSRLSTFVNSGTLVVENEGYADAVEDLINYLILFYAYVSSRDPAADAECPTEPDPTHSVSDFNAQSWREWRRKQSEREYNERVNGSVDG